MGIRRIAASYVYATDAFEPIRNGFVEYDEADGTIIRTGVCNEGEDVIDGFYFHSCL